MAPRTPDKRLLISRIAIAGFCAAVIYHFVQGILGHGFPYNTFLFDPRDRFMDFFNPLNDFEQYKFNLTIFPTQDLMFWFFSFLSRSWAISIFYAVFILYFCWFMVAQFSRSEIGILKKLAYVFSPGLISLPVLFALDRGNIEMWMFIVVSLFVIFYFSGRRHWASIFLALAVAAKIFPAVFCVFYLRDKEAKPFLTFLVAMVLLGAVLLIPADPFFTFARSGRFFAHYNLDYAIKDAGFAFGHSIWGLLKSIIYCFDSTWMTIHGRLFLRIYSTLTLVVYAVFAWLILVNPLIEDWKQLAILTLLLELLPHVSADYRLLHLFVPMSFFVNNPKRSRMDWIYAMIFGLIIIPKAYFQRPDAASLSVVLNPLLMLALLGLILCEEIRTGRISTIVWPRSVNRI